MNARYEYSNTRNHEALCFKRSLDSVPWVHPYKVLAGDGICKYRGGEDDDRRTFA
ncbi:hypothetical protein SNOG_11262 [Parastagonospora nodorum SN15]|uniref:Uncharacterized protein n=1 Tax=Phaeosphaeria nodorum (strain SN15 / ATCC MYA-4574 / FGSC 10173) TaxID=321614 RepID=Q0UAF2_PHANO|nr:hypothetical protein SNOG_11262 [Parastagonospora nodorum SN15]EAT81761.1 hypothetical protein SNOG_11262 [Parastagonospora nodorum SN15]